jgi:hypothetical protein
MAEVIYSIICENVIADRLTEKVSLINLVDEVNIGFNPLPVTNGWINLPLRITIITMFVRSKTDVTESTTGRIHVIAPSGETNIGHVDLNIDLKNAGTCRAIAVFDVTPVFSPGRHFYTVSLQDEAGNWGEVYRTSLMVNWKAEG